MRHVWNSALALPLALVCACDETQAVSQTVVFLDAERAARATLSRITVQSIGPADNRVPKVEAERPEWPIKLVFAPRYADATRRFVLQIEARDERDVRLVTLRLQTGFVHHQTRYAMLLIKDACAVRPDPTCGADAACNAWRGDVAADEFGKSERKARVLTVSCGEPPDETDTPEREPRHPTDIAGSEAPASAGAGGGTAGSGPSAGSTGTAGSPAVNPGETPVESCGPGYVVVAGMCTDVDECTDAKPCGDEGRCENAPGSYLCVCNPGYEDRSGTCLDIVECETNNAGCEIECVNSMGGVACACGPGESWLKLDRKACGSFGEPRRISLTSSQAAADPRFAFDGEGNGLAVWTQFDGTRSTVWTRKYKAADGWTGIPARLPLPEAGDASSARVALDASGRGAIVWLQRTADSRTDVWAARYTGQAFSPAEKIELDDAGSAYDPSLVLDKAGDGFAVWMQGDGTRLRIWVNRLSAATGWQGAQTIQNSTTEDAGLARISLDANGNASVVWTQALISETEGITRASPWIARFDAALARWRAPAVLDIVGTAGLPDVAAFGPSGRELTVWTRATPVSGAVWARSHPLQPSVREASQISLTDAAFWFVIPRVMLSPSGHGAAIWAQGKASAFDVSANRYDGAADSWQKAVQLSTKSSTSLPSPQIAVDTNGDGFAVWSEIDGTARSVRAHRLQAEVGFVAGLTLTTDTTADPPQNSPPQIAVDPRGNAMAIWDVHDAGQYAVWAAKFE